MSDQNQDIPDSRSITICNEQEWTQVISTLGQTMKDMKGLMNSIHQLDQTVQNLPQEFSQDNSNSSNLEKEKKSLKQYVVNMLRDMKETCQESQNQFKKYEKIQAQFKSIINNPDFKQILSKESTKKQVDEQKVQNLNGQNYFYEIKQKIDKNKNIVSSKLYKRIHFKDLPDSLEKEQPLHFELQEKQKSSYDFVPSDLKIQTPMSALINGVIEKTNKIINQSNPTNFLLAAQNGTTPEIAFKEFSKAQIEKYKDLDKKDLIEQLILKDQYIQQVQEDLRQIIDQNLTQQKIQDINDEISNLESIYSDKIQEKDQLEGVLSEISNDIIKQNNLAQTHINNLNSEIQILNKASEDLNTKLQNPNTPKEQKASIEKQLQEILIKQQSLNEESENFQSQIEKNKALLKEEKEQNKIIQKKTSDAKQKRNILFHQQTQLENLIKELEVKVQNQVKEVDQLAKTKQNLDEQKESLSQEIKGIQRLNDSIAQQKQYLEEEKKSIEKSNSALESIINQQKLNANSLVYFLQQQQTPQQEFSINTPNKSQHALGSNSQFVPQLNSDFVNSSGQPDARYSLAYPPNIHQADLRQLQSTAGVQKPGVIQSQQQLSKQQQGSNQQQAKTPIKQKPKVVSTSTQTYHPAEEQLVEREVNLENIKELIELIDMDTIEKKKDLFSKKEYYDKLLLENKEFNEKVGELEPEVILLKNSYDALVSTKKDIIEQEKFFRESNNMNTIALDQLKNQNQLLNEQIQFIKQEQNNLDDQLQYLTTDENYLNSKALLQDQVQKIIKNEQEMNQKIQNCHQELYEKQQTISKLMDETKAVSEEKDQISDILAQLTQEKEEAIKKKLELIQEVQEIEAEVNFQQKQYEDKKQELFQFDSQFKELLRLQEQISTIDQDIANKKAENEQKQQSLRQLIEESVKLQASTSQKQRNLDLQKAKEIEISKQLNIVKEKVNETKKKLNELKSYADNIEDNHNYLSNSRINSTQNQGQQPVTKMFNNIVQQKQSLLNEVESLLKQHDDDYLGFINQHDQSDIQMALKENEDKMQELEQSLKQINQNSSETKRIFSSQIGSTYQPVAFQDNPEIFKLQETFMKEDEILKDLESKLLKCAARHGDLAIKLKEYADKENKMASELIQRKGVINDLDMQLLEVTNIIQDKENARLHYINQIKNQENELQQLGEEEARIKMKQLEKREFIQQIGRNLIETDEKMSILRQKIKLYEDDIESLNYQIEEKNQEKLNNEKILRQLKTKCDEFADLHNEKQQEIEQYLQLIQRIEMESLEIESELQHREKTLIQIQNSYKIESELITRLRNMIQIDGFYETLNEQEFKIISEQIVQLMSSINVPEFYVDQVNQIVNIISDNMNISKFSLLIKSLYQFFDLLYKIYPKRKHSEVEPIQASQTNKKRIEKKIKYSADLIQGDSKIQVNVEFTNEGLQIADALLTFSDILKVEPFQDRLIISSLQNTFILEGKDVEQIGNRLNHLTEIK